MQDDVSKKGLAPKAKMIELLQWLRAHRIQAESGDSIATCWVFEDPVDTEAYPDYLAVIARPMNLKAVEAKVHANGFECFNDFFESVMLIWSNCVKYNTSPASQEVVYMAKLLRSVCKDFQRQHRALFTGTAQDGAQTQLVWTSLWPALLSSGWKVEHGHRPGDRYYMPPGVSRANGRARVDYFDSVKQVVQHCQQHTDSTIRTLASSKPSPCSKPSARAAAPAPCAPVDEKARALLYQAVAAPWNGTLHDAVTPSLLYSPG